MVEPVKPIVRKHRGMWRVEWKSKSNQSYCYVVLDVGKGIENWEKAIFIAIDSAGKDPFAYAVYSHLTYKLRTKLVQASKRL